MKSKVSVVSLLVVFVSTAAVLADYKDDIGYTALVARVGSGNQPDGTGIGVWQIEAFATEGGTDYMPNTANAEFTGKTISDLTGGGATSTHATIVGRYFYGNTTSIAPGITSVGVYSANDWLGSGSLRTQTKNAPNTQLGRVQNYSWISTSSTDAYAIDALRRLDYAINRDNVVAVVGVNNGSSSAFPKLLGNAYNAIVVGRTDGGSSDGPTVLDDPGRVGLFIVAPLTAVSYAAPVVGASAALLLETADNDAALVNARKAVTVKALLGAGATKSEFDLDGNTATTFDDWSRTTARPLDYRYGAGELNIDNSHRILTSGEQEASDSQLVGTTGWDYDTATTAAAQRYFFEVPDGYVAETLSILVTWNRELAYQQGVGINPATFTPSLANIDMELYSASGFSEVALLDQSVSTADNVEHIFARNVGSGRYVFELTTDQTWNYAVAWDAQLSAVPEPATLALLACGLALSAAAARRRRAA